MIHLYDESLIKKLKFWTENTAVNVYSVSETERLFQVTADKTYDSNIKLPIICLRRDQGFRILNYNKKPLSFDGMTLRADAISARVLNAIPISIPYQIDVYTRYQKENDMYMRNLIFNIINYPTLQINISYKDYSYTHNANIRITSSNVDVSHSNIKLFPDQFCRQTLSIDIDDAYLWDIRDRGVVTISDSALQIKSDNAEFELPDAGFITEYLKLGD